jgi:hypothetical protein
MWIAKSVPATAAAKVTRTKSIAGVWTYQQVEDFKQLQTLKDVRERYEKAKGKKMDAEELVTALKKRTTS